MCDSAPIPELTRFTFSHPFAIANVNSFSQVTSFFPRPIILDSTSIFAKSKTTDWTCCLSDLAVQLLLLA